MRLLGRTCIVTGATGGLGKEIATRFWLEGASLLLSGRDAPVLQSIADSMSATRCRNQKIVPVACDLRAAGAASALVAAAADAFGSVTVLVNNAAALGPIGPLWENDLEQWEQTIRVNLTVPAALCALVVPWMQKQNYGKIVNVSGGGAAGPRPQFSAYATAKAGLVRLTEVLAHETRPMNIDVNCIAPGVMKTRMLETILAAGPDRVGAGEYAQVQRRAEQAEGTLERAVELAAFLASSDSDGITGRLISAVWDLWETLPGRRAILDQTDIYTLRRIVPKDRGLDWDQH